MLAALFCEAAAGAIPFYIPILIALSFSQYAIDSVVIAPPAVGPMKSRLGPLGRYHQLRAGDHARNRAAARIPRRNRAPLAPLIAIFYIAAISERAWLLYRSR